MSSITGIIKKEVKELLTLSTLIPIIVMAIMFGAIGNMIGDIQGTLSEEPVIGLINLDNSSLSQLVYANISENSESVYNGSSIEDGISAVENSTAMALVVIPSGFGSDIIENESGTIQIYWMMRGAGIADSLPLSTVQGLLSIADRNISTSLMGSNTSISPKVILNPTKTYDTTIFKGKEMTGISPMTISTIMQSQSTFVPLIIVMVVIMAGSMVITSMGSEKENKTLETLLTLPISRTSIVFGKLIGAAIVGLIMAVLYMAGMGYYMNSFTSSASIDLSVYGLTIDAFDYVLMGISLFLALFAALALCMILGIFTKNYKASQMMTMPITFLALIPMFITMFSDFDTLPMAGQVFLFAIPFSHPMIAMKSLMFGDTGIVLAGIGYEVVFCVVTMLIAVTLFKKDILLTGKVKSAEKKSAFPIASMIAGMIRKR